MLTSARDDQEATRGAREPGASDVSRSQGRPPNRTEQTAMVFGGAGWLGESPRHFPCSPFASLPSSVFQGFRHVTVALWLYSLEDLW